jgi:hypothetical protein
VVAAASSRRFDRLNGGSAFTMITETMPEKVEQLDEKLRALLER